MENIITQDMMENTFTGAGFAATVTESSTTPLIDGYVGVRNGMPYHVHPTATPDEWKLLLDAINSEEVVVTPYTPQPVQPQEIRYVKGSDFRAILKMHKVVEGQLTMISPGDESLWDQITTFVSAAISDGVVQMLNVDEQLKTSERFDRRSKGIVDMIEYLPMIDESIADQVFAAAHALEVGK